MKNRIAKILGVGALICLIAMAFQPVKEQPCDPIIYITDTNHNIVIDSACSQKELDFKIYRVMKKGYKQVCLFGVANDTIRFHQTYSLEKYKTHNIKPNKIK